MNTNLAGEIPESKMEPTINLEPKSVQEIKPKDLPEQVKANLQMDKKNFEAAIKPEVSQPKPVENIKKPNKLDELLGKDLSTKIFKISLVIFGIFFVIFGLVMFLTLTSLDTKFIRITLSGKITDKVSGNPIANAQIFNTDNQELGTSDDTGFYKIPNLESGKLDIIVKADGYDDINDQVPITRNFMDYNTHKDYQMISSVYGSLKGKFISNLQNYDFRNDSLSLNNTACKINTDGTFSVDKIKVGNARLQFKSLNFKDIDQTITLNPGDNKVSDITLQSAGDIQGDLKSYIREDLVLNTKFAIENVTEDQMSIGQDGTYTIRDLDVGKNYKIRVTADGYDTRDYQIQIKQGANQLFGFKLVESGSAVFLGGDSSNPQFFKSDFDGQNLVQLTSTDGLRPIDHYYSLVDKKIYFSTTKDNIRGSNGNAVAIVYSLDPNTKAITQVTTNTDNLGDIKANYIAKKMLSVTTEPSGDTTIYTLNLMGLDGNNRSEVVKSQFSISDLTIADNGTKVAYLLGASGDPSGPNAGLDIYDASVSKAILVASGGIMQIFDISEDGTKILFSKLNPTTSLTDLMLYNSQTSETRTIKENLESSGFYAQFVKGDNNKIIYVSNNNSIDNIYQFSIRDNKEDKITNLSADVVIQNLYQESGLAFYLSSNKLYVLDIRNPKSFKLVTDKNVESIAE